MFTTVEGRYALSRIFSGIGTKSKKTKKLSINSQMLILWRGKTITSISIAIKSTPIIIIIIIITTTTTTTIIIVIIKIIIIIITT